MTPKEQVSAKSQGKSSHMDKSSRHSDAYYELDMGNDQFDVAKPRVAMNELKPQKQEIRDSKRWRNDEFQIEESNRR